MGDLRKNQGGIPVDITPSLSDLHRSLINDMLSPEFLGIEQVALLRAMDISVDAAQSYIADAIAEPDGAAQIGTASGNTVQQELDTRVGYTALSASTGGDLVGFIQDGAGAVARTLLGKNRDIVHANDFGLVGDGTDETALLQQALNAAVGKVLMLGNAKTYGIGSGGITIPANTTLISNGSKFKKLASSSTYGITISGSFNCDNLLYETVGGTNDAGINVAASDVTIGKVSATSLSANTGTGAPVNGLLIHKDDVTTLNRIWIGSVNIVEWAAPMRTRNVDGIYVGPVTIDNFRTGYYCINTRNGMFVKGDVRGLSPSSVGGPGDNGVLIESTFDYGTENLMFVGWHVEDAGEHGFRIGGQNVVRNIKYVGCSSTNSGAATGATGGAAFKVLHGNTNPTYHENIIVDGFTAIDCGADPASANNNAAVQIGKVKGGQFSNFTIRKRNKTYSCRRGFQLIASEDIEINNPNITDAENYAFQFIQSGAVTPAYPTTMSRVHVNGGQAHCSQNAVGVIVAKFEVGDGTFTDVSINGTTLSGGRIATQHDTPTGAGAYVD